MKLLLCSDLHRDLAAARELVDRSDDAGALVVAGDLAVMRNGLQPVVDVLAAASCPVVLVPGNGESEHELSAACSRWAHMHVLHGSGCEIGGRSFWGLGGGVPITPFGAWSFDLSEEQARGLLTGCPADAVLVTHSPPHGHVDEPDGGGHLGSRAVLEAIESRSLALVVCGHIHACWEQESTVGETRIVNAGPCGVWTEI
ncbi:MAG: metallophosphoesterase family protein [Longimicrobiales bacterium]|jgi:Icc-related predicted phosphoesterase|nr:metallophosphoesterase family protein [Longimicrobiales bacterium]